MKHFINLILTYTIVKRFLKRKLAIYFNLFLLVLILPGAVLFAQNTTITGVVNGSTNESIPGATIIEQGTSNGTITGIDGSFRLQLTTTNPKIEVSFVGYNKEIIDVTGKTEITVTLTEEMLMINEMVVIGYGSVKKSDLTGSVSSVKASELEKQPITEMSQALQGRTPGVMVTTASGAPGAGTKIRIRGMNSIYGDNNPLYIVDGIAMNPDGINVNDIESIEVLKDASSTAIYGNRGSNGVILITTKRGKAGKTKFDFDYTYGFDQIPASRKIPTLNAVEYMNLTNTLVKKGTFSDEEIANAELTGESTDWQDEILQMGSTQNYQLAVSGGNERSNFYVAGSYISQEGIIMNTGSEKFSLRTNLETKINDKVTFVINNNIGNKKVHNSGAANIQEALVWSPSLSVRDSLGNFNYSDPIGHKEGRNPVASLTDQNGTWEGLYINTKAELNIEILPGLSFRPVVGLDYINSTNKYFNGKGLTGSNGEAGISNNSNVTIQNSNILSYIKTINNVHDINIALVNEWIVNRSFGFGVSEKDIPNDYFEYYNLGTGSVQNLPGSNYTASQMLSFLGRANYTYAGKYMLTASLRSDASSKFKGNNKWGYFPSAAVAWKASEEQFIKDLGVFYLLKFRLSYGVTGSQAIAPYQTQSMMGSDPRNFGYPYATTTLYRGYGLGSMPNEALRWETTETQNAGVDISFFNGKLNVNIDVFNKNTTDMLYPKLIPVYQGGGTIMTNVGTNNNKGVEFNIDAQEVVRIGDFRWSSSFNASFIETKITDLADSILMGPKYWGAVTIHRTELNRPASGFYLLEYAGVWKADEIDEAKLYRAKPGMPKYIDQNDDKLINADDYTYAGSPYPNTYWGWTNNFSYKNIDLSIFINGSHGAKRFNHNYLMMNTTSIWANTLTHRDALEYYDEELRPNSDFPSEGIGKEPYESTRFLQDASYVKIKNIALSYSFDKKVLAFTNIKLAASVQNAAIFTNYKGYDPESYGGGSDIHTGFDAGTYPTTRSFSLSIKASF